jgi:Ca2+-binding RTX toxin-like protein
VIEEASAGIDEVIAEVDYTLGDNVERLRLAGTAALDGTGNALGNRLVGSDGANLLRGMAGNDLILGNAGADTLQGGIGRDRLSGGTGADVFLYAAAAEAGDQIADFTSGEDQLLLLGAGFGGLEAGSLAGALTPDGAARFISADSALATAEAGAWQFIFDTSSATLILDTNGTDIGGRTIIARLSGATLAAGDIVIG